MPMRQLRLVVKPHLALCPLWFGRQPHGHEAEQRWLWHWTGRWGILRGGRWRAGETQVITGQIGGQGGARRNWGASPWNPTARHGISWSSR